MRKRSEFSHRHRHPRAEDHGVDFRIDLEGRDGRDICGAIKAAEIGHEPNPGKDFALEGSIPTVQMGATARGKVDAAVGISEEHVSTGGDLSQGYGRQQTQNARDRSELGHNHPLTLDGVVRDKLDVESPPAVVAKFQLRIGTRIFIEILQSLDIMAKFTPLHEEDD